MRSSETKVRSFYYLVMERIAQIIFDDSFYRCKRLAIVMV